MEIDTTTEKKETDITVNGSCTICLSPFTCNPGDDTVAKVIPQVCTLTGCGHSFHSACLAELVTMDVDNNGCPICRQKSLQCQHDDIDHDKVVLIAKIKRQESELATLRKKIQSDEDAELAMQLQHRERMMGGGGLLSIPIHHHGPRDRHHIEENVAHRLAMAMMANMGEVPPPTMSTTATSNATSTTTTTTTSSTMTSTTTPSSSIGARRGLSFGRRPSPRDPFADMLASMGALVDIIDPYTGELIARRRAP